jgi:hypothetical protein
MLNNQTRRGFLFGAGAVCLSSAGNLALASSNAKHDESTTVVMADVHLAKRGLKTIWGEQPDYQNIIFSQTVDKILEMRPLPRRVVVLGDVALWFGYRADYETAFPLFARLKSAGIDVHLVPGNHDHREPMISVFPECAERSPVKGRIASVVNLGTCDLFLVDSLQASPEGEGANNPVGGQLDEEQGKWLSDVAENAKRPFIVASHHSVKELRLKDKSLLGFLSKKKYYCGYINGHVHQWTTSWCPKSWDNRNITRMASLPSVGWWGDIGFAVIRTKSDCAELTNVQSDFFYSSPLKKGEARPASWDAIVRNNNGQKCTFSYGS